MTQLEKDRREFLSKRTDLGCISAPEIDKIVTDHAAWSRILRQLGTTDEEFEYWRQTPDTSDDDEFKHKALLVVAAYSFVKRVGDFPHAIQLLEKLKDL